MSIWIRCIHNFHILNKSNRLVQFCIGVNLGDIVEEADRIYGDGVNIAARLETFSVPGRSTRPSTRRVAQITGPCFCPLRGSG